MSEKKLMKRIKKVRKRIKNDIDFWEENIGFSSTDIERAHGLGLKEGMEKCIEIMNEEMTAPEGDDNE